jgi:hypothetical protein
LELRGIGDDGHGRLLLYRVCIGVVVGHGLLLVVKKWTWLSLGIGYPILRVGVESQWSGVTVSVQ